MKKVRLIGLVTCLPVEPGHKHGFWGPLYRARTLNSVQLLAQVRAPSYTQRLNSEAYF